ncbi:TPA: hypothetical protein ACKPYB_000638 [Stenotrophomonas maltophilia]
MNGADDQSEDDGESKKNGEHQAASLCSSTRFPGTGTRSASALMKAFNAGGDTGKREGGDATRIGIIDEVVLGAMQYCGSNRCFHHV